MIPRFRKGAPSVRYKHQDAVRDAGFCPAERVYWERGVIASAARIIVLLSHSCSTITWNIG
ncbi:MAG: hypothetical protein ABW298_10100, partial [Candidatus Binatia bacterium]